MCDCFFLGNDVNGGLRMRSFFVAFSSSTGGSRRVWRPGRYKYRKQWVFLVVLSVAWG